MFTQESGLEPYMWLCRGGTVLEVMAELMGRTSGASKVSRCLLPAYKLSLFTHMCLPVQSNHSHEQASQVQSHLGMLLHSQSPCLKYASLAPEWPRWLHAQAPLEGVPAAYCRAWAAPCTCTKRSTTSMVGRALSGPRLLWVPA